MPDNLPETIFDALRAAQARGELPTSLGTAELRELGAGLLSRSVFTARGSNAIFTSRLKEVIDQLSAGDIGEGQARTALYEILDVLGYDSEKGGFPGEELEPALKGTLQDLRSFRRMDLIVRTQVDLMQGAGLQFRGQTPERLATFPAWELVRVLPVAVPRDWPSRWAIAGGKPGRMIALKGDPVWGELGSYDNFKDALGVDHPPFAFNSGMGWREVSSSEVEALGITGPHNVTAEEFHSGVERPRVMAGELPLPTPRISLAGVDPELVRSFQESTSATTAAAATTSFDYSDILEREIANRSDTLASRAAEKHAAEIAMRNGGSK